MTDNCVFLDASFWISYRDPRENNSKRARRALEKEFQQRSIFVTTLPVICEIQAYFARHPTLRFMILDDLWQNPVLRIEEVTIDDQDQAIDLLRSHRDKAYSLCDSISFVVMRRLGVRRVASYDEQFRQFGEFEIVN